MSDNASTYTAASEEITLLLESDYLTSILGKQGIQWCFIPKCAPWYSGWWEHLVGLIKITLKKVLRRSSHTYCSPNTNNGSGGHSKWLTSDICSQWSERPWAIGSITTAEWTLYWVTFYQKVIEQDLHLVTLLKWIKGLVYLQHSIISFGHAEGMDTSHLWESITELQGIMLNRSN